MDLDAEITHGLILLLLTETCRYLGIQVDQYDASIIDFEKCIQSILHGIYMHDRIEKEKRREKV